MTRSMYRDDKYARLELERRWLVTALPSFIDPQDVHDVIEDRYLLGTRMRLRRVSRSDGSRVVLKLGMKQAVDGAPPTHHQMTTLYLSEREYAAMTILPSKLLEKRRYRVQLDGAA